MIAVEVNGGVQQDPRLGYCFYGGQGGLPGID
jgi:hypothetical protein